MGFTGFYMLCIKCDGKIDDRTGICTLCGHVAFKVDDSGSGQRHIESRHVEPYLPGSEVPMNESEGRVSMISTEPDKTKIPSMPIIANIVIILGIVLL